jgi:hypothetical protein
MTVREFLNGATNDEVAGFWLNIYATAFRNDSGKELDNISALTFFATTREYLDNEISMRAIIGTQKSAATNRAFLTFADMKNE